MTLEEVNKLSDGKIKVKVAELCGYKQWGDKHMMKDNMPYPFIAEAYHGEYPVDPRCVPNYPNDLNAMHEAAKGIPWTRYTDYQANLVRVIDCGGNSAQAYVEATAKQRCKAFIMVMTEGS